MKLTQPFATSELYTTGPDTGTPTKIDPAGETNGFVRGTIIAAQHMNFPLSSLCESMRRLYAVCALQLRPLSGTVQDDLTEGLAALAVSFNTRAVLAKASSSGVALSQGATYADSGVLSDVGGSIAGGCVQSNTAIVIGQGTTNNCRMSITSPGTWTAGGSTGLLGDLVGICSTDTNVVTVTAAGGSAYSSDLGATWANPTPGDDVSDFVTGGGITSVAALDSDVVVAVGLEATDPAFAVSADGGVTWSAASGTVPHSTAQNDAGFVASSGRNATEVYHVGFRSVNTCDVAASADGETWTTRATLTSQGSQAITGVRIWVDALTDLMVVGLQHSFGVEVFASTDTGLTWSESIIHAGFTLAGLSVAAGRLFGSRDGVLFGSDGVGSE